MDMILRNSPAIEAETISSDMIHSVEAGSEVSRSIDEVFGTNVLICEELVSEVTPTNLRY